MSTHFPVIYNVSFMMDGVESVRRIFASFTVLPNPRLLPFNDDRKEYRGEILSLEVSYATRYDTARDQHALERSHGVQTSTTVTPRYLLGVADPGG